MTKHIKIRRGVWETNSSSSHSLSIASDALPFIVDRTLLPDQYGSIILQGGEFGWEWKKYNDARTKADYLAVACASDPDLKERLTNVIRQQTGCTNVFFPSEGDCGYIDHQSCDVPHKAFETDEMLRSFIFNMNSWLFTGNDNSEASNDFHDVPIFEENRVIMPEYKYELRVEGVEGAAIKFKKKPTREQIEAAIIKIASDIEYVANEGKEGGHFDTEGGVYAQIMRSRMENIFEVGYDLDLQEIDFKNCTFPVKNKRLGEYASRIYERDFKKDIPWDKGGYEKTEKIKRDLLRSGDLLYSRRIKYTITKL